MAPVFAGNPLNKRWFRRDKYLPLLQILNGRQHPKKFRLTTIIALSYGLTSRSTVVIDQDVKQFVGQRTPKVFRRWKWGCFLCLQTFQTFDSGTGNLLAEVYETGPEELTHAVDHQQNLPLAVGEEQY